MNFMTPGLIVSAVKSLSIQIAQARNEMFTNFSHVCSVVLSLRT